MIRRNVAVSISVMALAGRLCVAAADPGSVTRAFDRFFAAPDRAAETRLVGEVAASGVTFDEAYARLKRGRTYSSKAPRGLGRLKHRTSDGMIHDYAIIVPLSYTPSRPYQVRVQLHGGISVPRGETRDQFDRIPGTAEEIVLYPSGWVGAQWWFANQVENITGILDDMKRTWNVDENRIYLTGISDGGTGTYFMAFRETTPWASFLPLNGDMFVLANPNVDADGDLYPGNAVNKPFYIVNGGMDMLYPAAMVEPDINHLRRLGTEIVYHPQPDAGHNTNWWPTEKDSFEQFVRGHVRRPLPDRLSWETERTDRYNRAHWLVIDALGTAGGEAGLGDTNIENGHPDAIGEQVFPRRYPSGRVDIVRTANTVEASTRGVKTFTLLLSPDTFDFNQPVKVITNGRVAFEGKVEKSVATLLKWAARDNDRTMLFGAEITIHVTGGSSQ